MHNTPEPTGFALFDTTIGACAIAWNVRGIAACQLPAVDVAATRRRIQRLLPGVHEATPPADVQAVCDRVAALLRGERIDFSDVPLDDAALPELHRRVYQIALGIAPGTTLTYGDVARQLGDVSLARAVGQALGRNPFAPIVPCHRVMASGGQAGGFSAPGGLKTKLQLLQIEGAPLGHGGMPGLFDDAMPQDAGKPAGQTSQRSR
jgi:methylated-DNA-[protein]-cysteine S-methyltransferase